MGESRRAFIPAAGHDWLLPLYDPLLRLFGEGSIKRALVEQARVEPDHRALDIGCGTGTLTVLIKQLHPSAEVVGLDPDARALTRATQKAERAGLSIRFDEGFSSELPYPDASFDRVFSSFMLHHLEREEKLSTLQEVRRVLRPGGSLHLLDFGEPRGRLGRLLSHVLHSGEQLHDNVEGRVPGLMRDAGLADVEEVSHRTVIVGSISYYRASHPATESSAA
jgi:ubiquinone/menaquinone biosynthesis C-methylase UbiE